MWSNKARAAINLYQLVRTQVSVWQKATIGCVREVVGKSELEESGLGGSGLGGTDWRVVGKGIVG